MMDEICTRADIKFSFADRLRVLVGSKVTVSVNIKTQNVVGATETESRASVEKFWPKRVNQKGLGEAISATKEPQS